MSAKRHARLIVQPCAPLAGHVARFRSLDVSSERSSPRGYAFFVPLGGGERPFGFTPTFTGHWYYSKKQPRGCAAVFWISWQSPDLRLSANDGHATKTAAKRSDGGLAGIETRIGILLPASIHLTIVHFDKLLDSGNLVRLEIADFLENRIAIGLDEELRRNPLIHFFISSMNMHSLNGYNAS